MTTSKQILAVIAQTFPRVPEKNLKKLSGENATAEDIYVVVHLLERYIQYQDAVIATLVRDLMAKGILGRPAAAPAPTNDAPAPDAADGGADWVMAGLNPNDKSSPTPQGAAAASSDAAWVMAGVEGDGPAPSSNQPGVAPLPPAPPQNGGAAVPSIQPLPNVQASGAPVPNDIQAMFAKQAAEMNKTKPAGQ